MLQPRGVKMDYFLSIDWTIHKYRWFTLLSGIQDFPAVHQIPWFTLLSGIQDFPCSSPNNRGSRYGPEYRTSRAVLNRSNYLNGPKMYPMRDLEAVLIRSSRLNSWYLIRTSRSRIQNDLNRTWDSNCLNYLNDSSIYPNYWTVMIRSDRPERLIYNPHKSTKDMSRGRNTVATKSRRPVMNLRFWIVQTIWTIQTTF
jgi:hypothetical protein